MSMGADRGRKGENPGPSSNSCQQVDDFKLWGIFIFSLVGATATTFAMGVEFVSSFYGRKSRSFPKIKATVLEKKIGNKSPRKLPLGRAPLRDSGELLPIEELSFAAKLAKKKMLTRSSRRGAPSSSYRSSFQEGATKRCAHQRKEEYEEEMERVERIRRVQSVFNRERNKYKKSYESLTDNGSGSYNQHFQRDDWYWKIDPSYKDHRTNYMETPSNSVSYSLSQHYLALGLDRSRTRPYSDSEIKIAFQAKVKQCHPDQNQDNKDVAEAKFKEVMESYRAIRQEREGKPP